MKTYLCGTEEDPEKRPEPAMVSSVYMSGTWSHKAYRLSHDGRANIIYLADGIEVQYGARSSVLKMELPFNPRDFMWHPDSRRVAFWVPDDMGNRAVGLLDVRRVQGDTGPDEKPYEVVYDPPDGHMPYGLEWSPGGQALYVLESVLEEGRFWSVINRVELNGRKVEQIVRLPRQIDFFMPPVSRFENGSGASSSPYFIVFGTIDGLHLVDPRTTRVRRLSDVPSIGLHNVEWNPRKDQLALFFRHGQPRANGDVYAGVYLIHLDRVGHPDRGEFAERLHEQTDVHTLWFSPRGTYVTWSSEKAIWFRPGEGAADGTVHLECKTEEGLPLPIKGVCWSDDERLLAVTAGNRVFLYDVRGKKLREIARFGEDSSHFSAEPRFIGERVYLTVFQDLRHHARGGGSFTIPEDTEERRGVMGDPADAPSGGTSTPPPAPPPGGGPGGGRPGR